MLLKSIVLHLACQFVFNYPHQSFDLTMVIISGKQISPCPVLTRQLNSIHLLDNIVYLEEGRLSCPGGCVD